MTRNRYEPPHAALDLDAAATPSKAPLWIARALGAACVLLAIVRVVSLTTVAARGHYSLLGVYLLCPVPLLWAVTGMLVYSRSRRALGVAAATVVATFLLPPLLSHLGRLALIGYDGGFDYVDEVATLLRYPMPIWGLYAAVIAWCLWDYRQRFAGWRTELPEPLAGAAEPQA